ncbi:hypothetical protein [Nonomuraea candida]|uniref:hypothetical protein n=1 Tax=Nonomuraea candida TaxID=359159 RepID=UPI0005B8A898|nr:hypothetical protein [Nonomuraea candida]
MSRTDDAQAGLAEIAKRREQAIDGALRGRHRGCDAAGSVAMIAGFAALDLSASAGLRNGMLGVALLAALVCFTRAGRQGRAVMHQSQLTGRFWAVLGGFALAAAVLAYAGMWLATRTDLPLRHTAIGVVLVVLIAVSGPLFRKLTRRATA